jgi:hypothetical protein
MPRDTPATRSQSTPKSQSRGYPPPSSQLASQPVTSAIRGPGSKTFHHITISDSRLVRPLPGDDQSGARSPVILRLLHITRFHRVLVQIVHLLPKHPRAQELNAAERILPEGVAVQSPLLIELPQLAFGE